MYNPHYLHVVSQTHYHTLQYPKTKEKKIWTKGKIEPQHIHQAKIAVFTPNMWPWKVKQTIMENHSFPNVKNVCMKNG